MCQCFHKYEELLRNNRVWVSERLSVDEKYFEKLSEGQNPPFLFIGCSDSRKPLDTIIKAEPGELFIHTNIANQVSLTDMNVLSILEYAIETLEVEHIIICGHYNCGGVEAAYTGKATGLIENWLMGIKELKLENKRELQLIENEQEKMDRLCEINVVAQLKNLCKTSMMHKAFKKGKYPKIHGWIFDIYTGHIKELELPLEEWKELGFIPKDYEDYVYKE